eukprot:TRINITY_DN4641_c0_g1_i2.p1 TRINITY_DN4641_c0_g1~~TRINITY_DN4641_c0_g1_i2.p1  ORF type:complete len:283 (+),score=50.57 TRINITY_DN4641_c0_g1_i2:727-1575(+)
MTMYVVFTRDSIPQVVKSMFPLRETEFIQKVKNDPVDSQEYEWWEDLLKNTEMVKYQYKPGKWWYDPKLFEITKLIEENFEDIRTEALEVVAKQKQAMIDWPEKFLYKDGWQVLGMYAFSNKLEKNCVLCPKTTAVLEKIDGLETAIFSCLDPRAHIKPHIGYYQYSEKILRMHMGLQVPKGCVLKVNGEERCWEEGKCLVFDDTFRHEAWNPSHDTVRIVLMLDVEFLGVPEDRNPEFYAKSKKQEEKYGSDALISNDLLQVISKYIDNPAKVQERPKVYD